MISIGKTMGNVRGEIKAKSIFAALKSKVLHNLRAERRVMGAAGRLSANWRCPFEKVETRHGQDFFVWSL